MQIESELRSLAIRGVGWLVVKRVVTQILLTGANLILVRLLFPSDFGAFAIVNTVVTLFWVFSDLGLGKALVQRRQTTDTASLQSVWWTQTILGLAVIGAVWVLAPFILNYYRGVLPSQALVWIRMLVLSEIFVNMSLVSAALLERRLAYGRLFIGEMGGLFVTQSVTIFLAATGMGVTSFVYGNLLGRAVSFLLFFGLSPWRWGFGFRREKLLPLFGFGVPLQMAGWIGLINGAVVPLYVGRFPGPGGFSGTQAVGFVSWAAGVATIPAAVSGIFEQILFPLLSRCQENREFARRIFQRVLGFVAFTTFPTSATLLVMAPSITAIIYTPAWLPALPSLRLAILQITVAALNAIALTSLLAFGEVKFYRNLNGLWAVLQWALTIPLVILVGFWGVNLAALLVTLTGLWAFLKLRRYFAVPILGVLKGPLLTSLLLGGFLWSISRIIQISGFWELVFVMALGGGFYALLMLSVLRSQLNSEIAFIRGMAETLIQSRKKIQ